MTFDSDVIKSTEMSVNVGGEQEEEGSITVSWEKLWVTVPNGNNKRKPILQGLTGYAQPARLLAIMGPSGCGKSTLLDALSGDSFKKTMWFYLTKSLLKK